MKFQKHDIFPTSIVKVDVSDKLSDQDHQNMMKQTDLMIENGQIQPCPPAPLYQTNATVFNDDSSESFLKLRQTFIDACGCYLSSVSDFCPNQNALEPTGTGAWVYKGWKNLNETQSNPWHNHNPAFLSGVYYLKVPGDLNSGGTEFHDPKHPQSHNTRNIQIAPTEKSWIIFPGWLMHKTNYVETSEDTRYVVAANLFVRVRY